MQRPEISLENHESVYDFYRELEPIPSIAKLGHFAVSQLYKPNVSFESGAEEQIREGLRIGNTIMLIMNHVYAEDVVHAPAMLQREEVFRPMITRTNIYGKASLISSGNARRLLFDGLGMVPVFRRKDAPKDIDPGDLNIMQLNARKELVAVGSEKLSQGFHIAIFPEGKRSENFGTGKRDPTVVKPLKDSFIDMIFRSDDPENTLIVPAGIYYPIAAFSRSKSIRQQIAKRNARRKPNIHVEEPIKVSETNRQCLLGLSQESLQSAVDSALKIRALSEYSNSANDGSMKPEIDNSVNHDPDLEA